MVDEARTRVLAEGLRFGEGPRWRDGRLWLSDMYDHQVKSVGLDGDVRVELTIEGQPSGLGWLPDGRLLVVSMVERQVLRREADGAVVVHADLSHLASYHCNDMVVDGWGRAYVGNFGFDLDHYLRDHGVDGLLEEPGPPRAVLCRVDPGGACHVAADGLEFPNGSVLTPDGRTLVVAETVGRRLTAFSVDDDGHLHDRRTWADFGFHVAPDGIALDADGNVWVANPLAAECVLVAEGGMIVDRVATGQACFACMLGGPEGRHLFLLTARTSRADKASVERSGRVLVTEVDVPHAGLP